MTVLANSIPRREWQLLALLVGAALIPRLWMAGAAPLHPDELHYVYDFAAAGETGSLQAIRGLDCTMLVERRTAHPMLVAILTRWLWFLPLGWAVEWTPAFFRGFSILAGAALVIPMWLTGRVMGGARQGIAAGLLAASGPGLIWISRTAYLEPVYTLLIACWLATVAWGGREGGIRAALAQGFLFGLVFSTKISAPLLLPAFLAGALMAPSGTPWRERSKRAALSLCAAIPVWIALCDPAAYLRAIFDPSDVRYATAWEEEDVAGIANLLFIHLNYYFACAWWDGPATTLVLAAVGGIMAYRRRNGFALFLLLVLFSLLPLSMLHHPRLSGSHGFMPIYMVLVLLASNAAAIPGRWLVAGLAVHLAFSGTSTALRTTGAFPWTSQEFAAVTTDARYTLLKDWLHRRNPSIRIVILPGEDDRQEWVVSIRNAQLSEGAVVMIPCSRQADYPADPWQWADVVAIHLSKREILASVPADFDAVRTDEALQYAVFRRTAGVARQEVTLAELTAPEVTSGLWRLCLPDGVHPVSGTWRFGGQRIEDPSGLSPYFTGPQEFLPPAGSEPEDITLELHPPHRDDVIWGF